MRQARSPFTALLASTILLGCGARSSLVEGITRDTPRVPDCERLTPEAIPLARIAPVSPGGGGADGFHLAADDDYLYFTSEARIWRVSKRAGAPEPLTPEGSAGGHVHVTADAIVWSIEGEIRRAPIAGGVPETVVTFPSRPLWTVAGDAILSSEPQNEPAPVLRTPLAGGPSTELVPAGEMTFTHELAAAGDRVLVRRSADLLSLPEGGGAVTTLSDFPASGGATPVADAENVYFGARSSDTGDNAIFRVAGDGGSPPELMISGFPISMALDGQTLYANIALPIAGSKMFSGALVRRSSADGSVVVMTKTDAEGNGFVFSNKTAGLAVDEVNVYFIELCAASDPDFGSYRLVSLPKDHTASP